jgi:hypothetical protein
MAQRPPSSLMQSDICLDLANMSLVCERFNCEISHSDCDFGQGKRDSTLRPEGSKHPLPVPSALVRHRAFLMRGLPDSQMPGRLRDHGSREW